MRWLALVLVIPAFAGCLSDGGDGGDPPGSGSASSGDDPAEGEPGPSGSGSPGGSGGSGGPGGSGGSGGSGGQGSPGQGGTSGGSGEPGSENDTAEVVVAATEPDWGEPAGKGIRPGINSVYKGSLCTTSFVFTDGWERFFLASAAHCMSGDDSDETDGCLRDPDPPGGDIELRMAGGGTATGKVAYSSWHTMRESGAKPDGACRANDFALIEIKQSDVARLHPAPLHFDAIGTVATSASSEVWGYGASSLKFGISALHPKQGLHLGTTDSGWGHLVYLATPGIPGDSGGFITTDDGQALGVASVIYYTPYPAANRYTDFQKAIDYMEQHTELDVEIVDWGDWDPTLF